MKPQTDPHVEQLTLERVVLFTDAVFAIVITLMAIEIRLPEQHGAWSDAALAHALAEIVPKLLAYVISFFVVALLWTGHLRRFRHLRAVDPRLTWLNLLQMLFIGLLPFFTAVLASSGQALAASLYAADLALAGLCGGLAWHHGSGQRALAAATLTPVVRRQESWIIVAMTLVFAASIPLAWWRADVAMLSWLLLWPLIVLVRRVVR